MLIIYCIVLSNFNINQIDNQQIYNFNIKFQRISSSNFPAMPTNFFSP